MPHDKNSVPIVEGDRVYVECVVKQVMTGNEYCNVTLETVEPMYPGPFKSEITLNTKQVVKLK